MIGLLKNKSQYYMENFFLVRDGVQYPRIFAIHSRIIQFYSINFTFITQEFTNTLLKKFEGPCLWFTNLKMASISGTGNVHSTIPELFYDTNHIISVLPKGRSFTARAGT